MQTVLRNQSDTLDEPKAIVIRPCLTYCDIFQVIIKVTERLMEVVSLHQLSSTTGNVGVG